MANCHFEAIKLYNLFANDLLRLGKILRYASPTVKTLYYETTECSSIHALASLGLKPESLIIRNEDPQIDRLFGVLTPLFGPTLRTLSLHRSTFNTLDLKHHGRLLGSLTSLSLTGSGFIYPRMLYDIETIEEIILDFDEAIRAPDVSHIPWVVPLPYLRVFKLRGVPCPTQSNLPALSIHAPMLHTFHLDSTAAALWLLTFSGVHAPTAIVDFRVDKPTGPVMSLSHLQPFLCDTIESFALTSVSHDLDPLLHDIHAGYILPRRKHLEFTFHDA